MIRVLALVVVAAGCGAGGAAAYVHHLTQRRHDRDRRHKLPWEG